MNITNMDLIKMELDGLYGPMVMRDMDDIISMYNAYEGILPIVREDDEDIDYTPTDKRVNYIKRLIKFQGRFMFGKTPDFSVITENESPELQKYLNNTLRDNLFADKLVKGARDTFIGKRIALKINVIEGKNKKLRVNFIPSLEFVYEPKEDDPSELQKIIFFYTVKDSDDKSEQRIWRQKYEMLDDICYMSEAVYNGVGDIVEERFTDKKTGLDFIPAYVLLNDGLTGEMGESDVKDLISPQSEYNRLSSEDIDALLKAMNDIIYFMDIDNRAIKKIKNRAGATWDLATNPALMSSQGGGTGSVGVLNKTFAYDGRAEKVLDRLETEMHKMMEIPEVDAESLSGAMTSAKAMKTMFWSLISKCEERWSQWEAMLRWMCFAIIEISKVYGMLSNNDEYDIEVSNNYPIPEDTTDEMNQDLQQVNADAMSRASFYKKWRENDDDKAMDELRQIALEKRMFEDMYGADYNIGNNDEDNDEGDEE